LQQGWDATHHSVPELFGQHSTRCMPGFGRTIHPACSACGTVAQICHSRKQEIASR
jgi:hypothetical protein